MPYTYKRGTDGAEDTITIHNPHGGEIAQITFWHDEPDDVKDAEETARLIVNALNAYQPPLFDAVKSIVAEHDKEITHEELRKRHYERLNDYRDSVEYQASSNCYREPTGTLRTLIGDRWEIDEEIYDDALDCLPPLGWRGGVFYIREFTFDDITAKFSKESDKYYCEFARYPGRKAA